MRQLSLAVRDGPLLCALRRSRDYGTAAFRRALTPHPALSLFLAGSFSYRRLAPPFVTGLFMSECTEAPLWNRYKKAAHKRRPRSQTLSNLSAAEQVVARRAGSAVVPGVGWEVAPVA